MSYLRPDWRTRQLASAAAVAAIPLRAMMREPKEWSITNGMPDMLMIGRPEPEIDVPIPDSVLHPERRCTRRLPGHPVELHADEVRCWRCGNADVEGA